jgi:2-polyprenyl-3-methyl-5-hydroxy-6-metoxy-1,4-benzoquinol methylase
MLRHQKHIFDRSGIAALSDLKTQEWSELYDFLKKDHDDFFNKQNEFLDKNYKWPRQPLYSWSRIWEYPYIYYHLRQWGKKYQRQIIPAVVDFGSGVTFFPFSVAKMGIHVTCVDIDPVCEGSINNAKKIITSAPGNIDFKKIDNDKIPFKDEEIDAIYCISVLEHIPNFVKTIKEINRILKPRSPFFLTVDIDIRGDSEIGPCKYKELNNILKLYFDYLYPDVTIHPADILDSYSGPRGFKKTNLQTHPWFYIKQELIKPILNKKPRYLEPWHLTIQGFSLIKKQ